MPVDCDLVVDVVGAAVDVVRPVVTSRAGSRGAEDESLFEMTFVTESVVLPGFASLEVVLPTVDVAGAVVDVVRPDAMSRAGSRG